MQASVTGIDSYLLQDLCQHVYLSSLYWAVSSFKDERFFHVALIRHISVLMLRRCRLVRPQQIFTVFSPVYWLLPKFSFRLSPLHTSLHLGTAIHSIRMEVSLSPFETELCRRITNRLEKQKPYWQGLLFGYHADNYTSQIVDKIPANKASERKKWCLCSRIGEFQRS